MDPPTSQAEQSALRVLMLGPLTLLRGGQALPLPSSRKVRALLAYLALAPKAHARSALCELLWEIPNDPRGELRWCLSKIRGLLGEDARARVLSREDTVALDLSDCFVDVREVAGATDASLEKLRLERLRELFELFRGEFLEGLDLDRSPLFNGWLVAQRRRIRGYNTALLEQLAKRAPEDEAPQYLERWLEFSPFDQAAHLMLFKTLGRRGQLREGEAHLAAALELFEHEGLDGTPLRQAWRAARGEVIVAAREPQLSEVVGGQRARASIAVMPFADQLGPGATRGGVGDALAYDVITRLAKLRSLFVIAQGSVFTLHERGLGHDQAGRLLNVDYVVGGVVRAQGERLSVHVELSETRSGRIVWAEVFNVKLHEAFAVLEEIGNRIVASVASEIETLERNRAILKPPNSLDAWEAHHRGLWHMYQYRQQDNEQARHFFQSALRLDPTFSRAYAGLSFTHFQDAFQNWQAREHSIHEAYAAAAQGIMADERDPAVHWALGRALWLRGTHEEALNELNRSIELSPNFAMGHYNLSFVHAIVGDASAAIQSSDYSRQLSPYDPMLFGMFGTRAMALARLGRFEEAAQWAVKAAARPNAFPHIHAIAACCLGLIDELEQARVHVAAVRASVPNYRLTDFFMAFPFDAQFQALFRKGGLRVGLE